MYENVLPGRFATDAHARPCKEAGELQVGNLLVDFGAKQAAFFAQDHWRIRPSLTFDYGLRWEGQWNPKVSATNTDLVNKINSVTFPNGARADVTKINDNLKQFMPRAGFAWSPAQSRRLVVRGHKGIFYAATPLLIYSDPTGNFRNPPNNVRLFLNNTARGTIYQQFLNAGVDLDKVSLDQLPVIPLNAVQQAAAFGLGTTPDPFIGAGTTAVATDYQNPRSYQAGIGSEAQLTRTWSAGLQFNYKLDYGYSNIDARHTLGMYGLYNLAVWVCRFWVLHCA